jgi:hypothetical protein
MVRLLIAALLLMAYSAHAALIAFDAQSETTGTTTLSWTHTPVGTPRAAVVFCVASTSATDVFSGATYGGTAMTLINGAADSAGEPAFTEGYFLGASVPTGAQTAVCTISSGTTAKWAVAYTFTNVLSSDMEQLDESTIGGDFSNCGVGLTPTKAEPHMDAFAQFSGVGTPLTTAEANTVLGHNHDFGSSTGHSGYSTRTNSRDPNRAAVVSTSDDCAGVGIAMGVQ